jgi:hypothetical protein
MPISRDEEPLHASESIAEKEPRITCAKDLDDALRLYQSVCCKDDSVDTSLVTPKSINKAYFDLFKSDAVPSPAKSTSHTPLPPLEPTPSVPSERLRLSSEVSEVVRNVYPEKTTRPTGISDDTR